MRLSQLTSSAVLGCEAGSCAAEVMPVRMHKTQRCTDNAHANACTRARRPHFNLFLKGFAKQSLYTEESSLLLEPSVLVVGGSGRGHLSGSVEEQAEVAALPARDETGTLFLDAHQGAVDAQARSLLPDLTPRIPGSRLPPKVGRFETTRSLIVSELHAELVSLGSTECDAR